MVLSLGDRLTVDCLSDLKDKRVFVRVDFNVPMDKEGKITSDQRIVAALPTLTFLIEKGAKVIVASHLGRPDGNVVKSFSLASVALHLEKLLKKPVTFVEDCVGPVVEEAVNKMSAGDVLFLENLRFHLEEEGKGKNEKGESVKASSDDVRKFRSGLRSLCDVYVNDAFGTCHRAHSSMVGIDVTQRAAGFLLKKELNYFSKALECPEKPYVAILGGKKVQDKIKLIENLLDQPSLTHLIIGGGMAYTFKKARGMKIGKSILQADFVEKTKDLVAKAKERDVELHLPVDFLATKEFSNDSERKVVTEEDGIPDGWEGVDIGPSSREDFSKVVLGAKTIVWNGPMGVFEMENFSFGTRAVMDALVEATKNGAVSVVGGGDSATCCLQWGMEDAVSHISTGGGASLELLEGKELPGVASLSKK